jgi:hypothetical protein
VNVFAQSESSVDYTYAIKNFDFSKLWRDSSIITHSSDGVIDKEPFPFPEPLGYIGKTYQRFYIHYTSIKKDTRDPYVYWVKGKTSVTKNVCNFSGTITVTKAILYNLSDDMRYKEGEVMCKVDFREDTSQPQTGRIQGNLVSGWCLNKQSQLFYDAINFISDGYNNNQCTAIWTCYNTHQSKICNWGDFRMPNSRELDMGAGDVSIDKKYVKNGWQNYIKAYTYKRTAENKSARAEENRKWWR